MHRRPRLARPLWPGVLAAVISFAALGQSQPPAPAPSRSADATQATPPPESGAAVPAGEPAPSSTPDGTLRQPTQAELEAEEAERKRRREAVGDMFAEDSELARQSERDERSLGSLAFQTFLALGIVILLVYLTLNYGLRRMMGLRPIAFGGRARLVDVVERIPLDQKKAMYVVKAAGEYLLVGGTEGGLNLISKLDGEAVAQVQRDNAAAAASAAPVSPFLQKLLSRRDGTPPKTG